MNFGEPAEVKIVPLDDKTRFRFRLRFRGRAQPVEFDASADFAMGLLKALQHLQALHKIPIPATLRSKGKPILRVLKSDNGA